MSSENDGITADGSPVWAYLALPAGETPSIIHDAVRAGGSILELGCGVGRITRPLLGFGHSVVAVDESDEMLAHVTGAEAVQADLLDLDLGRQFDAVVAGSHLVDDGDPDRRRRLLDACRRHVADDGVVLVERFDQDWAADPGDSEGTTGPVRIAFRLFEHRGTEFDAAVVFWLGDRVFEQKFTAAVIDDDTLIAEAGECGLVVDRWLDERRTWALLRPL